MKFNSSIAAAALVTLAVGACKSETKNETVNADTTATAPVAAPATPAPPPGPVTANLEAKDNSGVTGTATATHGTDSVTVEIKATGLKKGTKYAAHIHSGTCAAGGPVVVQLTPPDVATGESKTVVAVAAMGASQPLFAQVHGAGDKPVACGDLPGHGEAAGAAGGAMAPASTTGNPSP